MAEQLHEMGFKIMVWVTPMVTCDTHEYRILRDKQWLVREKDGNPAIRGWWDGYSAVMDLTNPEMCAWFEEKLNFLMQEYGIDGFKFDAGDAYMYRDDDLLYKPMPRGEHMKRFQQLGLKYKLNEFRASYNMAGRAISSRLADRAHAWDHTGLASVIPNTLAQGITGYVYNCPDMIGGGDSVSFETQMDQLDQELIVQYSQACALCAMMQFSLAPWRVLRAENFGYVLETAALHTKFGGGGGICGGDNCKTAAGK